jgi:hypothetical protein
VYHLDSYYVESQIERVFECRMLNSLCYSGENMLGICKNQRAYTISMPPPTFTFDVRDPNQPRLFRATRAINAAPTPLPSFAIPIRIFFSPLSPIPGITRNLNGQSDVHEAKRILTLRAYTSQIQDKTPPSFHQLQHQPHHPSPVVHSPSQWLQSL